MKTLIIGHRGYLAKYPENTIESFIRALEHGADGIEFDVHLSSDGEVMVYHDFELSRLTNGHGSIGDFTCSQLQSLRIKDHDIMPTLKEVMMALETYQSCNPTHDFYLNVELKASSILYPDIEQKVLDITASFDLNRIIYSSFDHHALVLIKQLSPHALTGVLTSGSLIHPWEYLSKLNADFYHPHYQFLTREELALMNEHQLHLNVYTVNDKQLATQLFNHTNMIITNEVEKMVQLKQELEGH